MNTLLKRALSVMFIKLVAINQKVKKKKLGFCENVSTVADTRWMMGRWLMAAMATQ